MPAYGHYLMPAYGHYLWHAHAFFEASGNRFVSQIVKCQITYFSPDTQAIPCLPERNICNWKDKVRGLRCLINML